MFKKLFGKKSKGPDKDDTSNINKEGQANEQEKPRKHHYEFGKFTLPMMVLGHPEPFISNFLLEDGQQKLRNAWNNIGEKLPPSDRMPDDGLELVKRVAKNVICMGIIMPKAISPNELHFSYVICDKEDYTKIRIFGLEKGREPCPYENPTVLAEWNKMGRLTYDAAPKPDFIEFEKYVFSIMADEIQVRTFTDFRPMGWFSDSDEASPEA
ncbi:hypothetical protein EUZ85_18165 [Hahella sp. KA22]|uniref:hypothetical protein n=1 Tax=Hahella sp. KA22 TaxID=1628392 RepID=UPI000FDEA414|nr:hypothetical protein [Hahella sp. KA22]AZZ92541.1 hypothetical protein ENC22_15590 [Hahella sp. KA22]QAY55914.1 hypothetical protein EUZ85_18165 [Hahella sp. KA22]